MSDASPTPTRAAPLRTPAGWISLFVAVGAAVLMAWRPVADPDTWWHIAAGEWMRAHGTFSAPPLSLFGAHGCEDATTADYRLGFPVFAWLWRFGGVTALVALPAIVCVVLAVSVWRATFTSLGAVQAAVWGSAAALLLGGRLASRTELFSYLLVLALFGALSVALSSTTRRRGVAAAAGFIFLLLLVWPELHSGVVFGVVVTGASAVEAWLDRRASLGRAVLPCAAAAGALVLSSKARALLVGAALERTIAHEVLSVGEWLSPIRLLSLGLYDPLFLLGGALALALALAWLARPAGSPWRGLLVGTAFFALALEAVRNIGMFALTSSRWLPRLAALDRRARIGVAAVVAAAALWKGSTEWSARGGLPTLDERVLLSDQDAVVSAARFASEERLSGRVHGSFNLLNYLLVAAPNVQPMWSGRRAFTRQCGELLMGAVGFPDQFFARADARWHFDHVLVRYHGEDKLFRFLVERDWQLAFLGSRDAWFVRPGAPMPTPRIARTEAALFEGEAPNPSTQQRAFLLVEACKRLAFVGDVEGALGLCRAASAADPDDDVARAELAHLMRFIEEQKGAPTSPPGAAPGASVP